MTDIIYNTIGTSGVFLILLCYFLLQTGKIELKGFAYSFMNLAGSILIFISLLHSWNLPSAIIEICWFVISIYGLYKWWRNNSRIGDKNE